MKDIFFVRHGEATVNVRSSLLYEGHTSPLTEVGWQQAEKIAERASRLPVEALIASTMLRTQQTASVIAKRIGGEVESSDLFTERRDPSSFIGRIWNDPETQRGFEAWRETAFTLGKKVLDGENFEDIRDRAQQALSYLEKRPESNILVVTHGMFLRVLVGVAVYGDFLTPELFEKMYYGIQTTNTGITLLRYDPKDEKSLWTLRTWNDHAHLG